MKPLLISSYYFPHRKGGISNFIGDVARALGLERVCCLPGIGANGGQTVAMKEFSFARMMESFIRICQMLCEERSRMAYRPTRV